MTTQTLSQTVEEYLRSKNRQVHRAGSNQLTMQCLWHDDASHAKGKLYINAEHGAFDCKICGTRGGFRMLMEFFGDEPEESLAAFKPSRRLEIQTQYAQKAHEYLFQNSKVLEMLLDRGMTKEILEKGKIGYHPRGVSIMDALPGFGHAGGFTRDEMVETGLLTAGGREIFSGRIIIPYITYGQAQQIRSRAIDHKGAKYQTLTGDPARLYNQDVLRGADTVIITEGEFDCLMLQETLSLSPDVKMRNVAVVGVAGVQALPLGREKFGTLFEHVKRVYVGFDADAAGRRGALDIKDAMGTKVRILELPEEELDWSDFLGPKDDIARPHGGHGWKDVQEVIRVADARDKRLFTVQDAAAALREIETSAPAIRLGYPSLDALIAPGLRPGSLTVPLARTGNGKSIFLQNVMYYTRHIPTLAITLELTAAETWVRLRRIARFHHPGMDDEDLMKLYENLRICDQNSLRQNDLNQLVEEFAEDHGQLPSIGHVDYLGYYARSQPGREQYEKVTSAILSLKEWAKEYSLAVLAPGQVNRGTKPGEPVNEDSARDAGPVEETADFLFGIWRPWESEDATKAANKSGAVQSALNCRILKSRHGNKGRTVALSMGHHSLAIVDPLNKVAGERIDQENVAYNRGEKYEDYFRRQRENAYIKAQGTLPVTKAPEEVPPWEQDEESAA